MACSLAEGMNAGLQAEAAQGGVRVVVQTAEFGCAQLAGPHQTQEGVCIDLDSQRYIMKQYEQSFLDKENGGGASPSSDFGF